MTELHLRPITGREELDLFCQIPYVLNDELADDLDSGRRRPEWLWIAMRGERLVARAALWAPRAGAEPVLLDFFDFVAGEAETGTQIAKTVMENRPKLEYIRFVPPNWRDDPREVQDRMAALERLGARLLVERLRLQWNRGAPVPAPSVRLTFRPVRDRDELVGLMAEVLEGTLDAHSLVDLEHRSPADAAAAQYEDEFTRYKSPRDWWKVATLPDGQPVGFVIPARNTYGPIIAYIGVLPAHRGKGYIDDILAEGTRILAAEDVERIRAATDVGNVPMARAFERAGYVNFERQIDMVWD